LTATPRHPTIRGDDLLFILAAYRSAARRDFDSRHDWLGNEHLGADCGSALARREGWKVLERIREDARTGRMPGDALIDGFLVLLAGVLFVLPGVLTDVVGILLLFPPSRSLVKRGVAAWFKRNVELHVGRIRGNYWPNSNSEFESEHDKIIDARVIGTRVEEIRKPR
jgi:UPF0716 protein FxsA